MKKAVIFIADSNQVGLSKKLIAPTVKLLYQKAGWKCRVVDLYTCDFDPLQTNGLIQETFMKSFYHEINGSSHVHIFTHNYLGGYSAAFEGFIENMFNSKYISESWKKKRLFIHINYVDKSPFLKSLSWSRFTSGRIKDIFKTVKVFSSDLTWTDATTKRNNVNKIKKYLTNLL